MRSDTMDSGPNILKKMILLMALAVFALYGFLWLLKPRKVENMSELLEEFYYNFLKIKKEDLEVVKLTDAEVVTVSRNPCPILKLALLIRADTKYACRLTSETVCRYVLKRINPRLVFERNYGYIRPYRDGCMERIYYQPHN